MIYLALGSNLGNKAENISTALNELEKFFRIEHKSDIIETEAILPDGAPEAWNLPYLNMVIAGTCNLSPIDLLIHVKTIEEKMGRDLNAARWSPRVIDIDIIDYDNLPLNTEKLVLPHPGLINRGFLKYLMHSIGYEAGEGFNIKKKLSAKIVGIVNVTPDSFSDGNNFLDPGAALNHIKQLQKEGVHVIELGAQSTRPGYIEVGYEEEIRRLAPILERCRLDNLGIDSYFDEVICWAIKNHNARWINDIYNRLAPESLKLVADNNLDIVVMMHGMNYESIKSRISVLNNYGISKKQIVVDPGIGFGKTKLENWIAIRDIELMKQFECRIMLAHSRKSFLTLITDKPAPERDFETGLISANCDSIIDFARTHHKIY